MSKYWTYEKLNEKFEPQTLPINDWDGSITGNIVINIASYFDENPELCRSLGWVKHIKTPFEDLEYDSQTHNVAVSSVRIDEYTIEDQYHFIPKTEEQMLYEELGYGSGIWISHHNH